MSASWIVNAGGRAYGPYTDVQMTAFAAEGRLAPQSLIARDGESEFRPASQEPALATLFSAPPGSGAPEPSAPRTEPSPVFGRNKDEGQKNGERAHIIIIADMKSRSISGLEEEIYRLGQAYPLLPQIWLLRTDQSVNTVRNLLVQQLGKLDVLFVVDATNNKAAWFNFGPEADARIRRIWTRTDDGSARLRQTG
jgi:hypothetical protein